MPNLAMRMPASQFSRDGLNLSWPLGGEREVVAWPDEKMTLAIKRRIAEGHIVIVDDAPTGHDDNQARVYRLLTGDEARAHMAEPAGPVTRVVYHPATPEDEKDYQLEVQGVQMVSPRAIKANEAAAVAAEERHAAITNAQVQAEKDAAKEAKTAAKDAEPDPLAERLRRSDEATAEWHAAKEKDFMARETERQKEEQEAMSWGAKPQTYTADGAEILVEEPDTSAEDEAFMAAEKVRQKREAEQAKERAAAAKVAQETAETQPVVTYAGKTDPHVDTPASGGRIDTTPEPQAPRTTDAKPAPKANPPVKSTVRKVDQK